MYTYRPKELIVLANGISLSDFAEDSFLEITPVESEKYITHTGADGTTSRTENSNTNYIVKLVFKQGSASAKYLYGLSDLASSADIFNFTLQDPASSEEFLNSITSYVISRPSGKRGKEAGEIDIEIMLVDPTNNFI